MRKTGAILLGMLTLLLSLETSVAMHFCHNTLVETSVNRDLSGCCKDASEPQQPQLKKQCCEIVNFTADFDNTTFTQIAIALSQAEVFTPIIQFEVNVFHTTATPHFVWREPPPKPYHKSLHILFEQYLI